MSFVSCKNFLNGQDTAEQLKTSIAYANAKPYLIKVTSQKGTGTITKPAAGESLKKVTDSFEIRFEPIADYEFLSWEVSSDKLPEGASIDDYIVIENPQSTETRVTFKKELENIVISATVIDRPRVISYSPMTSGILKDSSIIVQFNRDMDTDSIYYTDPEIAQLKAEGKIPRSATVGGVTKYYGYQKEVNGVVETFYKNISIVNNKTDENLASYFNAPVFESPRVLSISANKDKPLDDYTQVLVLLEKNFFYSHNLDENNKKPVTMSGIELWMYQVNNRTDDEALVFQKKNDKDLFAFKLSQTATDTLESKTAAPEIGTNGNSIANFSFLKNKAGTAYAYLDVQLQDVTGGAGPTSSFNVIYERVLESDYTPTGNAENKTGSFAVEYQISTSEDAVYKGDVPLNLPSDGLYRLYFDFADRSENHLYWPDGAEENGSKKGFYITKDETPVTVSNLKLSSDNNTTYKLEWSTSSKDYKKAVISWGNTSDDLDLLKGTNSKTFTVNSGDRFDISITYTDYAGNTLVETIPKFITGYAFDDASLKFDKYGIPNVFFEDDNLSDYGLSATVNYSDGSSIAKTLSKIPNHSKNKQNISDTCTQTESKIQISKIITLENYYIAASGAKPTQRPVRLTNYSGSYSGGTYYIFGDFPQTVTANNISYSTDKVYKDWYLGSDGYFYEKSLENAWHSNNMGFVHEKYSNGQSIPYNTPDGTNYFKVEPIKWRVLNPDATGTEKKILVAETVLTSKIVYYGSKTESRTLDGKTIYPSNYKYSNIRAWLNGIDNQFVTDGGTRNNNTPDWSNKGFLQKAFTISAQELIASTEVSHRPLYWNEKSYVCDNTIDKIFLLGHEADGAYGFLEYHNSDFARMRPATDYALAIGVRVYDGESEWWSRVAKDTNLVRYETLKTLINSASVDTTNIGVLPALCLESLSD
ncbi:MAG: DUF6273 domain-containing protein [Treponema sp.]|nr:DUF6273 domain-containing protein [Treponema sp.]